MYPRRRNYGEVIRVGKPSKLVIKPNDISNPSVLSKRSITPPARRFTHSFSNVDEKLNSYKLSLSSTRNPEMRTIDVINYQSVTERRKPTIPGSLIVPRTSYRNILDDEPVNSPVESTQVQSYAPELLKPRKSGEIKKIEERTVRRSSTTRGRETVTTITEIEKVIIERDVEAESDDRNSQIRDVSNSRSQNRSVVNNIPLIPNLPKPPLKLDEKLNYISPINSNHYRKKS